VAKAPARQIGHGVSSSEWFGPGERPGEGGRPGRPAQPGGSGGSGGRRPPNLSFGRRRGPLAPTIAILIVLGFLVTIFASLWTEILWFGSVGYTDVFTKQLWTKVLLFVVGFVITAALVASSLVIAWRSRPIYAPVTPQQQNLDQYREAIEPLRKVAMVAIPGILGLLAGAGAAGQWKTFLLWRNGGSFGATDPQFKMDISFFVFTLPWIRFVLGFLTMALVMALVAAAFTHYVYGGLQIQNRGERTTRAARTHLAILAAALVLVRAATYWFDRYSLATQANSGPVETGINYTAANAVLPTKVILAVAAIMTAGLFIAAIWTRSWRLPVIGLGLLVVTSIVVGSIYPALVQRFQVRPSEKSLEQPYLQRNIDATRKAYAIDKVEVQPYTATTEASPGQLRDDAETVPGIRLVDPNVVSPTFKQLQSVRNYYAFPDSLDVDRYTVDGQTRDTVVAVRELDLAGVPEQQRNWLNDHTVYTHGFGMVAAYGNQRTADGEPVFYAQNIPQSGKLPKFEPRIYFGEESPQYSIVGGPSGAAPREFDYPSEGGQENNTYAGSGGVDVGSFPRKVAYALKYRELNFLLSNAVNGDSKILDHRQPLERVERVAPWLTTDGNPYPAVVDGRVQWIVDGYTTTADYPYSSLTEIDNATSDSVTARSSAVRAIGSGKVNYIRNSVKATVDAYDGTVKLYAWDANDPLLKAWNKAFDGTVRPMSEIDADLMSHLRYPEDLFKVQRQLLTRFHVTDADSFYGGQDFWEVPEDPSADNPVDQPPYYLTLKLPEQESAKFSLTTTFKPRGDRQVLTGFLSVDADAGKTAGKPDADYGTMRLLALPKDTQVRGPGQVQNDINSSNQTSPAFSLTLSQFLNNARQQGSNVTLGNLLTLPVGGGLLYVQPIYVAAQGTSAFPLLRATVVAFGDKLAWSDTLDGALDGLFGGNSGATAGDSGTGGGDGGSTTPPTTPTTPTTPTPPSGATDPAALAKALTDIQSAYDEGQKALRDGDFAAYGAAQKKLDDAIKRAVAASPKGGTATVKPTPTPTGTATSTP
jgi:uncharacterized membrane protein (UPF0182 family)